MTFANTVEAEPFVHPVVRAIILHFYLSFVHPFVDGNGRRARALFYRSMLRQGYWLAEFLSFSRLLQRAPTQYARSFLLAETDESVFTYFLLHQLKVICVSIDELFSFLETKVSEVRSMERQLMDVPGMNHRQLQLLSHAVRHPDAIYTYDSHAATHNVVYQTARTDLLNLEVRDFLQRRQVGKQLRFYPAQELAQMLSNE